MKFIINIIVSALAVVIAAYLLPGVSVASFITAILIALVLGILNVLLKPLLIILTIPITLISFGLFLLVINAVIILIAGNIVSGFEVDGFWWAFLFSIVLSAVSYLLHSVGQKEI